MAKPHSYLAEQTTIRKLLQKLGHNVVLRSTPKPAVFLDHEPSARFHGASWPEVYVSIMNYFIFQVQNTKTKSK